MAAEDALVIALTQIDEMYAQHTRDQDRIAMLEALVQDVRDADISRLRWSVLYEWQDRARALLATPPRT